MGGQKNQDQNNQEFQKEDTLTTEDQSKGGESTQDSESTEESTESD